MTQTEMEDAINNLDRRLVSVEQLLPTLATKEDVLATRADLHAEIVVTRRDVTECIDEGKRHSLMLWEDVRDDIRKVAEGVATLTMVVQEMGARLERVEDRLPPR